MKNKNQFNIYVPSYKRYDTILTNNNLEYCTYVVRKTEEESYRKAGITDIWAVDDELINSAVKVFMYIINNAPETVFAIIDDDIKDFMYRTDLNIKLEHDKETITAEIERLAQIVADLDIGYCGIDVTAKPYSYDREFAFTGITGPLKIINNNKFKGIMDDRVSQNVDCDLILQELLVNRIILKPKYLCADTRVDVNSGGSNEDKRRKAQEDSVANMELKWGKYFTYNWKRNIPQINVSR